MLGIGLGTAIAVAIGTGLGGCDLAGARPEPLGPDALTDFYAQAVVLADRYDATIAAHQALAARLQPLRDAHRAHVAALARELALPETPASGFPPRARATAAGGPASPVPAEPGAAMATLAAAEKAAARLAVDACLSAPSWRTALLGSIAACRSSHLEVLA